MTKEQWKQQKIQGNETIFVKARAAHISHVWGTNHISQQICWVIQAEIQICARELMKRTVPCLFRQGPSSLPPSSCCLLWAGSVLYPLGWDEDAAALLSPLSANGSFLSSRKSPRACCGETLRDDYTAAHWPRSLGCQPPTWAHAYIPVQESRQEKQFPSSLTLPHNNHGESDLLPWFWQGQKIAQ